MMLKPLKIIDIIRELPPESNANEAVLAVWERQGVNLSPEQKQAISEAVKVGTINSLYSRVWKAKKK
jgi:hypothetical protein